MSTVEVSVALSDSAAINLTQEVLGGAMAGASGSLDVEMRVSELRLFEVDLDSSFKDSLLSDRDIARAEKNGLNPRAVVRTYEGKIEYSITRSSAMPATIWNQAKERLLEVGGELAGGGSISLRSKAPAVVAFETVLISYIAKHLSSGAEAEVRLTQHLAPDTTLEDLDLTAFPVDRAAMTCAFSQSGTASTKATNSRTYGWLNQVYT